MFYFLIVYFSIIIFFRNKLNENLTLLLSVIPLIGIILFRYGYGSDYFAYEYIYSNFLKDGVSNIFNSFQNIEPGFKLIMLPFAFLNVPYHMFMVTVNIIILTFFVLWIRDNSDDFSISMFLFYCMFFLVWVLSGVRQGIVISVSLYYLYNNKRRINAVNKIVLIILLSLIHLSSLFNIFLLLAHQINWNKKRLLFLFIACVIFSLLPFEMLLDKISFLPGVGKIINSYNDRSSLISLASLLRFSFFILIYIFYPLFEKNESKVIFADYSLIGFSAYFILRFSELTAARLTVITYMMVIVLVPEIMTFLTEWINSKTLNKFYTVVLTFGLIFSGIFFGIKELKTLKFESGVVESKAYTPFVSVFSGSYDRFASRYSYLLEEDYNWASIPIPSINDSKNYKLENPYVVVYEKVDGKNNYGIINDEGEWVKEPYTGRELTVVGDIIIKPVSKNIFDTNEYEDLSGGNRHENLMRPKVAEALVAQELRTGNDELVIHDYSKFEDNIPLSQSVLESTEIKRASRIRHNDDYYYILEIEVYGVKGYLYYDIEFEPIFENVAQTPNLFDVNGFIKIITDNGVYIGTLNGDIVWKYEK